MEHMYMIMIRSFYAETIEAIIKLYRFAIRFFAKIVTGCTKHKVTAVTKTKPLETRPLLS